MERDFLGLGFQIGSLTVKEAASDDSNYSAIMSSGMQWSFADKDSPGPQFLSFKANQDDAQRKTSRDALASPGFMTISTADALKSNQKPVSGIFQKNLMISKHVESQCARTVHTLKLFDGHSVLAPEAEIHCFSNRSNTVMSNPVLHPCLVSNGHNGVNSSIMTQPLAGFPQAAPVLSVIPPRGPVVGSTDLRNISKTSTAPAQLTIFYGGSVCVYDDISPEKAQAIMLLAGNGSCAPPNKTVCSLAPMQPSISMPLRGDCFIMNQPCSSALPSPLSLTSHSGLPAVTVSTTINEPPKEKQAFSPASNVNRVEFHNAVSSVGAASSSTTSSVALPQARKASLARFLEKRKERAIVTMPYTLSKNSHDNSPGGSESVAFPGNRSCPLPAFN